MQTRFRNFAPQKDDCDADKDAGGGFERSELRGRVAEMGRLVGPMPGERGERNSMTCDFDTGDDGRKGYTVVEAGAGIGGFGVESDKEEDYED